MISTVKSVKPTGKDPYQSANGPLYSFYYEFADGAKLQANHKTETCPHQVGATLNYEITSSNNYGNLGKVSKPKPNEAPTTEMKPNTGFSSEKEETQLDRIERDIEAIKEHLTMPF